MPNILLAIESSCDDTSASIISDAKVLSNVVSTQEIHSKYGGVIPEVASRNHEANIVPTVIAALATAKIKKEQLTAIAITRGPGLMGSLMVGLCYVKGLAQSLQIPIIEVNHMQAHIMAHFAEEPHPPFPFLCLTVSGGHTQIVKVDAPNKMELLGETIDDAAGEAFDKSGKLLGLGYPAGPLIDKLAKDGEAIYPFPIPKIQGLNFSFSGMKTAIRYFLRDQIAKDPDFIQKNLNDICCSIQTAIVHILIAKIKRAAREYNINHIAIAGGVSANSYLRSELLKNAEKHRWRAYIPKFEYCTDNAAMIGISAYYKLLEGDFADLDIAPSPRLKI